MNYPLHRLPNQSTKLPDLILDGDEEFCWPLRLSDEQIRVLKAYGLPVLAERKRLSDIDDVDEVIQQLVYSIGPDEVGKGEEVADDLYRKCLKIWNAWDMQR